MQRMTRRNFLAASLAAIGGYSLAQWGGSLITPVSAQGPQGPLILKPGEKFDLVIRERG